MTKSNCMEQSQPECSQVGMEDDLFGLLGFIIRLCCDRAGASTTDWSPEIRHVRDMWSVAGTPRADLAAKGTFLVVSRRHGDVWYPGHIGLVVGDGSWIHASARHQQVVQTAVPKRWLGAVLLNDSSFGGNHIN